MKDTCRMSRSGYPTNDLCQPLASRSKNLLVADPPLWVCMILVVDTPFSSGLSSPASTPRAIYAGILAAVGLSVFCLALQPIRHSPIFQAASRYRLGVPSRPGQSPGSSGVRLYPDKDGDRQGW